MPLNARVYLSSPPLVCSSLCLLPLGCINPVLQLQHEMKQRTLARTEAADTPRALTSTRSPIPSPTNSSSGDKDKDTDKDKEKAKEKGGEAVADSKVADTFDLQPAGQLRDAMSFDDFWCWCQSCKHGGYVPYTPMCDSLCMHACVCDVGYSKPKWQMVLGDQRELCIVSMSCRVASRQSDLLFAEWLLPDT